MIHFLYLNDSSDKLQRYREVGERKPHVETEGDDYHSWNEATMSQSIRKMQYAVRGQIVMRADEVCKMLLLESIKGRFGGNSTHVYSNLNFAFSLTFCSSKLKGMTFS
jgi:hypothetical protein